MGLINIDRIKIEDRVTPGDIILAQVKSLSETKKILLTIEDPSLGVIFSKDDETHQQLIPINQNQMKNKLTNQVYEKKVAYKKSSN